MKNCLQLVLFSCLFVSAAFGQAQMRVGVRGGVNLASYNFNFGAGSSNLKFQTDNVTLLTLGVPVEMDFGNHFALQGELNFIQKGFSLKSDFALQGISASSEGKIVVNWLEIPILAKAKLGTDDGIGGGFFFGPSIAVGVSGNSKSTTTTVTNGVSKTESQSKALSFKDDKHSQVDVALNFGGEINYGGLFFDARYQLGLTNMVTGSNSSTTTGSDGSAKTRGIALALGYRFAVGGTKTSAPSKTMKKR